MVPFFTKCNATHETTSVLQNQANDVPEVATTAPMPFPIELRLAHFHPRNTQALLVHRPRNSLQRRADLFAQSLAGTPNKCGKLRIVARANRAKERKGMKLRPPIMDLRESSDRFSALHLRALDIPHIKKDARQVDQLLGPLPHVSRALHFLQTPLGNFIRLVQIPADLMDLPESRQSERRAP